MDSSELFLPAIETMRAQSLDTFGPVTFHDYCESAGLSPGRTASRISIDSLDKLDRHLRANQCMVLRLGQRIGGRTDFAIVRVPDLGPDCFFLIDDAVFSSTEIQSFVPAGSIRDLLPFHLLNQLTERSATLLACSTGLLESALELDGPISMPISDSGVYAFDFIPHVGRPALRHHQGQVEVDGLFVGRRAGSDSMFVIEAKVGSGLNSVAKHKLAYPIFGMWEKVPADIPIVPVYIRIVREGGVLAYYIAECHPLGRSEPLTSLTVKETRSFRLVLPSLSVG